MPIVAMKEHTEIRRPLKLLVPLIKKEIELGDAAGIEHYRRAGEMLLEAKEQVAQGEWGRWLKRNFAWSKKTAQNWMKAAATKNVASRRFSTLSEFTTPNRDPHHKVAWHEPVRLAVNKVDVERLAQERQNREKEERLMRELGLRLIDIGYKALAQKLHPDKGGSHEAITRLNRVRDLLKRAI